jgi:GNAT superfamily N-acetyltransferase
MGLMTVNRIDQMEVRPAEARDAGRIAELFVQLGYPDAPAGLAQRLTALQANGAAEVLVAESGARVLGVLVMNVFSPLHVARPWAVISSLVVDQDTRSGGVGAALIARAQQAAEARGCAHLELSCSERRTRAHDFYVSQGFQEVRKRFLKKLPAGT